jgi:hypothetical protein
MVNGSDDSGSGSWFTRPPRPFPAQVWLEARYGFRVPPLRLSPHRQTRRRAFPAQVWLEARHKHRLASSS